MGRMLGRLIRLPGLHFLVLGGLLYAATAAWPEPTETDAAETISITAGQIEQLRHDLTTRSGRPPTAKQLEAAIDDAIDEEVWYREAVAIGLDRDNTAVRGRLVQIARFVAEDPNLDEEALNRLALALELDRTDLVVRRHLAATMRLVAVKTGLDASEPTSDEVLERYLRRHPERFLRPRQVEISHVFLSNDRRGTDAEADAHRLTERLRATPMAPDEAIKLGDPFLHGHHLPWLTEEGLQRRFGKRFATAAAALQAETWSEPVQSSYGWHVVWTHAVKPDALPPLAEVRGRVARALLKESSDRRVQETLEVLRARYAIRIERADEDGAIDPERSADG